MRVTETRAFWAIEGGADVMFECWYIPENLQAG